LCFVRGGVSQVRRCSLGTFLFMRLSEGRVRQGPSGPVIYMTMGKVVRAVDTAEGTELQQHRLITTESLCDYTGAPIANYVGAATRHDSIDRATKCGGEYIWAVRTGVIVSYGQGDNCNIALYTTLCTELLARCNSRQLSDLQSLGLGGGRAVGYCY